LVVSCHQCETVRPWVIEAVYLFDAQELVRALQSGRVKLGIASSVRQQLCNEAEICPTQRNGRLALSAEQRTLLALFR
jgi:hypothetical protein